MKWPVLLCAVLLAACQAIPADPDGTTERVREERLYRIGVTDKRIVSHPAARRFLHQVSEAAEAEPEIVRGRGEQMLALLERGEIDLTIEWMSPSSPWLRQLSALPPLAEKSDGDERLHLMAVARSGENEWISILHRAAVEARAAR
jgi:hypothetical protein